MALHKFSKPKSFQVDYCGCTAAALLLNEYSIRDGINFIRQMKSKREFVRTKLTLSKEGVKIVYDNEQKFATYVPSSMIAGSTIGKSSLHDTLGVVYISPLTGNHYPAFIHVYRCESSRAARKLLGRFRSYVLDDHHHSEILQLEQQLRENNLLDLDYTIKSKTKSQSSNTMTLNSNTAISSSSASTSSHQDRIDPVKSITEELQKKIDSQQPLLFPPKDYDTIHAAHGHIQRAQAWKSTEPTIIGFTPIDADSSRDRRHKSTDYQLSDKISVKDEIKRLETHSGLFENIRKPRFSIQHSDTTVDPVEAVSLAFEFLKDETGSLLTDNEGNIEHLDIAEQDNPVFRFRPAQVNGITKKKVLTRSNNNNMLANGVVHQNTLSKAEFDSYYNNTHYQYHKKMHSNRVRSETSLSNDSQPTMHLSPRFENRLANGSGAPISTNPLWTSTSPTMMGSQPNLLTCQGPSVKMPVYRHFSPPTPRLVANSAVLRHPVYVSHSNNKPSTKVQQQKQQPYHESQSKHSFSILSSPPSPPLSPAKHNHRNQGKERQYLDTNEFILRASDGQLLKNSQYSIRPVSRNHRSHTVSINSSSDAMLDVYY